MAVEQKPGIKRKNVQSGVAGNSFDPYIYLLVEEPPGKVWSMSTVIGGSLINLVPVYTSEQQALDLISDLQSRAYKYAEVLFSRLQMLFEGQDVRFILEPKSEIKGGVLLFKEGSNWGVTADQLRSLLKGK